ncbi:MAG: hypothetical protein QW578_07240 [Thermoplasmatales archaeon]
MTEIKTPAGNPIKYTTDLYESVGYNYQEALNRLIAGKLHFRSASDILRNSKFTTASGRLLRYGPELESQREIRFRIPLTINEKTYVLVGGGLYDVIASWYHKKKPSYVYVWAKLFRAPKKKNNPSLR